jgi:hypothetical protein
MDLLKARAAFDMRDKLSRGRKLDKPIGRRTPPTSLPCNVK